MATVRHNRHSVTKLPCWGWILWLKNILSHTKSYAITYIHITSLSSVQSLSRVCLFVAPWPAAHQASLSTNNSRSLLKLMSIKSVMPSNQLVLCHPLLLLPPIPHSIRVFSNESTLHIRWPKYWSFSFKISPSNEHPWLICFRRDWLDILAVQGTLKSLRDGEYMYIRGWFMSIYDKNQYKKKKRESSSTPQFKSIYSSATQLSLRSNSHIHTWLLEKPQLWLDRPLSAR